MVFEKYDFVSFYQVDSPVWLKIEKALVSF